jgi:hypothetical protein
MGGGPSSPYSEVDLYSLLEVPSVLQCFCVAMEALMARGLTEPSLTDVCDSVVTLLLERAGAPAGSNTIRSKLRLMAWNLYLQQLNQECNTPHPLLSGEEVELLVRSSLLAKGDSFSNTFWLEYLAAEYVCLEQGDSAGIASLSIRSSMHEAMDRLSDLYRSRFFEFVYGIGGPILNSQEAWAPRYVGAGVREKNICAWLDGSRTLALEKHLSFWAAMWQNNLDSLLWAAVELGKARAVI